jgi:CheY-like chemotaxis protein
MGARVLVIDDSPTLRRVVGAILAKHEYEALTAPDGQAGLDLLAADKVDLVLLDFVMPRMNGYQFCRELRARAEHRSLPVVLMSAKAEKIRDQFLSQTGALDAITKPFDARALIAVVEGALQRAAAGRVPTPPEPAAMASEEALSQPIESVRPDKMVEREGPPSGDSRADLAEALAPALAAELAAGGVAGADEARIASLVRTALDSPRVAAVVARLGARARPSGGQEVLTGDVAAIPLGEILQVLQMQRQTGVLETTNGKVEVTISLRDGFVDLAQAKHASPEFRLGRYFVDSNLLTRGQLEEAVRESAASKRLLGDTLVQTEVVTREDLQRALIRQTSEMIYDVLRWRTGRFTLLRDASVPEAESARLGLPVASIVMEGFRRVDEWRLIEESFQFDEVLVRNEAAIGTLRPDELTRSERVVLDSVDGRRTIREIIEEAQLSSFDTCKTFYRFLQSRLVRRRAA